MTIQKYSPLTENRQIAANIQNANRMIEGSAAEEKTETVSQERAEVQKPGGILQKPQIQDPVLGQMVDTQA